MYTNQVKKKRERTCQKKFLRCRKERRVKIANIWATKQTLTVSSKIHLILEDKLRYTIIIRAYTFISERVSKWILNILCILWEENESINFRH